MADPYSDFLGRAVSADPYSEHLAEQPGLDPASLARTGAVPPDVAAESQTLAQQTGLPMDLVQRNMDEVRKRQQIDQYNQFVIANPEILDLARDANFSQVAHDDVESMGLIKNIFTKVKDSAANAIGGLMFGVEGAAKSLQQSFGDVLVTSDGVKYVPPSQINNMAPDVIENFLTGQGREYLNQNGGAEAFATWQDVKDADGLIETAITAGVFGADQTVTSVPHMLLSLANLPLSALSVSGRLLEQRLTNRGDRTITPDDLTLAYGAGSLSAAMDRFGAEQVLGLVKALGTTAIKRITRAVAAEAATETTQEGIEYLAETLGINPVDFYRMADRMAAASVGGGVAGGGLRSGVEATHSGINYIMQRSAEAAQARTANEALQELTDAVQNSALRERSPEQFARYMDTVAPDTELYIDPLVLSEALQQSEVPIPDAITERVAEAESSGVPVRVTASEFATYLSDPAVAAKLLPAVRMGRPDAMNVEEADALKEEFAAKSESVLQEADRADDIKSQAVEIHNAIRDQIVATKRFRPDVAGAYATLAENFYTTTAARLGISPRDLFARFPLNVKDAGGEVGALQQPAYHGTPHSFTRFDSSKIGTGEGAQAYGHGLYFAENKNIAKGYQSGLSYKDIVRKFREELPDDADFDEVLEMAEVGEFSGNMNDVVKALAKDDWLGFDYPAQAITAAFKNLDDYDPSPELTDAVNNYGNLYQVDIPDEVIDKMLDWDKPLSEQPEAWEKLKPLETQIRKSFPSFDGLHATGKHFYQAYVDHRGGDAVAASEALKAAGIPGIKYLDAGSRTEGQGTRNFVVFDDSVVTILSRNGEPVTPAERDEALKQSAAQTPQTETQAFKDWFGDSKVVDSDGKPLVVYHGTKAAPDKFSKSRTGKASNIFGDFDVNRFGIFATPDPMLADAFANQGFGDKAGAAVMPLYMSIRNPLDMFDGSYTDELFNAIEQAADKRGWKGYRTARALGDAWGEGRVWQLFDDDMHSPEDWISLFKELGFDGATFYEPPTEADGISGQTWVAFDPSQIKSAIGNRGTFDPNDANILNQTGDRGEIAFARGDGQLAGIMSLFQNADLTTFLHEGGHFFLESLATIAAQPDAPAGIQEDMAALLKWFGYEGDVQSWLAQPIDVRRQAHEQFARGFEAWLMEGKAPSDALRPLFHRFRAWLVSIYKSIAGLNVQLTDEVRSVMSRMVATQEQITDAEQARSYAPLFDQQQASGMTEPEWTGYQESAALATEMAQDALQARSMRNLRWLDNARSKELKRLQKENALKRAQMEADVADEVAREPVRVAETLLKDGVTWTAGPDGEPVEVTLDGPHKLSREKLAADFGTTDDYRAVAAAAGTQDTSGVRAPWLALPGALMTTGEGLSADEVAELVGLSSGDELVQSLLAMEPRDQLIDRLTDQRMLERYGDLNDPASLQRAVDLAIHNQHRSKVVSTELAALDATLQTMPGGLPALRRAARNAAQDVVARTRVRDVRPGQFGAAESRAAKDSRAALESGDLKLAAIRKRDQMFNGYASRAASRALDKVETGLDYLRKFNRDSTRKNLDPSYRDQIDKLLERFELRKMSLVQIDRRASMLEWVKQQEAEGNDPIISDAMLDEAKRQNYRNMTVQEFNDLLDAVKNIEHLARLKHKLLTIQRERRFGEIVDEIEAGINEHAPVGTSKETLERDLSMWGRIASVTNEWLTHLRKLSSIARQVDGGKDNGTFWDNFVRSMNVASDAELSMRREVATRLHALTEQVPSFNPSLAKRAGNRVTGPAKLYIPAIKTSLSTEARIAVALNWGNEGNRQRIMEGNKWTESQAKAVIDTLTKQEMDFVQNVFDLIGEYWPQIAAKEERVTGVRPGRVDASPIETKHGAYPGGYYPIVADPARSELADVRNDAELIAQSLKGAVSRATTRRGHTKARVGGSAPVRLDLGVITQHVTQVIHDLAWHETLIDLGRLLRAPQINGALREHYGPEFTRLIRKTLDDVARGEVVARDAGEKLVNYFRVGSTIAGLGLSVTTTLLQFTGVTQSMVRVGYGPMLRGIAQFTANPADSIRRVREASTFMRDRSELLNRELGEITNKLDGRERSLTRFYFLPIQAFQVAVDTPTWMAAYDKAVRADVDHDQAVALADQAVRDAQSSGHIHDLAEAQRGNAYKKLLTNFYSYFSATYQLSAESLQQFKRDKSVTGALTLATSFFMLYAVPTAMGMLIREGLRGDLDDEDLASSFLSQLLGSILGVFPYIREIAGAIQGYEYRGPAGLSVLSHGTTLIKQIGQGDADEAMLRAANRFGGVALHYPSSQVDRTVRGIIAVSESDAGPQAVLVGPPKKD